MHALLIIALLFGFLGIVGAPASFALGTTRGRRAGMAVAASLIIVCVTIIGGLAFAQQRSARRSAERGTARKPHVATSGAATATTTPLQADDPERAGWQASSRCPTGTVTFSCTGIDRQLSPVG